MTGFVHVALAFSTLLSSQGADAHHQESSNSIRGNPANLPASHMTVKFVSRFCCVRLLTATQCNPTVAAVRRAEDDVK